MSLGDLAIDGGPGKPGSGQNGFQANDTIWLTHGCAASCRLFLNAVEIRQNEHHARAQEYFSYRRAVAYNRRQILAIGGIDARRQKGTAVL